MPYIPEAFLQQTINNKGKLQSRKTYRSLRFLGYKLGADTTES